MLHIFFGWKKASKCKKLIRRIQSRLKLLKNKRSSIVRRLRNDVEQLLKHGHELKAFDRVEQIFLDQSILDVYDLLDHYCEFLIINISYIRKHKDCPNDIGEALSTLIFASSRCGDLPELLEIRKLFRERYGQKFIAAALDLLPGNLVNHQIKENLSIQTVANDIKWSLVNEIRRSYHQIGPLAIEYHPELVEKPAIRKWEDEVLTSDIQSKYTTNDKPELQSFIIVEEERKILGVDLPSANRNSWAKQQSFYQEPNLNSVSTPSLTVSNSFSSSFGLSTNSYRNSPYHIEYTERKEVESCSSSSPQRPTELVYLDDIEEYKSPQSAFVNSQDQRLFMFKSSVIISTNKLNEKLDSRRRRKTKRQRRRSVLRESRNIKDLESDIYYGEKCEYTRKSKHRRKHQKEIPDYDLESNISKLDQHFGAKIEKNDSKTREAVDNCNLMEPCYCTTDDRDSLGNQDMKITTPLYTIALENMGEEEQIFDTKPPYLRIATVPTHRHSIDRGGNMNHSNPIPFLKLKTKASTCPHVHPKLPDYDQFVATFMALKKETLQVKSER